MLVPSTVVGLIGMALTGVLMVADWYIWDFPTGFRRLARRKACVGRPQLAASHSVHGAVRVGNSWHVLPPNLWIGTSCPFRYG